MATSSTAALQSLFDAYLTDGDDVTLQRHLAAESHLPGPRGNLELARAFAETAGAMVAVSPSAIWGLVERLTALSAAAAPTNTPEEFIPFCGAWAAGEVGASVPDLRESALSLLRALARDERWRMREAVANGIQALIRRHPESILSTLREWIVPGDWLVMRAVAAGVAEPSLLTVPSRAEAALDLHRRILTLVRTNGERRSEDYQVLRQGLEYTLSVAVQAIPEQGFAFMEDLVDWRDDDVTRIVRENLKSNRSVSALCWLPIGQHEHCQRWRVGLH